MDKAVDRPPPLQDDIDKAIEKKYNEEYKTSKGAIVDYYSAIALVNRYCISLPSDMFTNPVPIWESQTINGGISVSIWLPIQSPLKNEIKVSSVKTELKTNRMQAKFDWRQLCSLLVDVL